MKHHSPHATYIGVNLHPTQSITIPRHHIHSALRAFGDVAQAQLVRLVEVAGAETAQVVEDHLEAVGRCSTCQQRWGANRPSTVVTVVGYAWFSGSVRSDHWLPLLVDA